MNNDNEKDLLETNPEETEALSEAYEESVQCDCSDYAACCGCCEEVVQTPVKKRKIVTPVIIAAVAFVLVAAVVFGGVWIYSAFFGTSLKGVWIEKGYEETGIYFEFDGDNNVYLRGGGISYFGNYETKTYDMAKDTELPEVVKKVNEVQELTGKVNVLKSDFYMFGMYGGEYIYTTGSENGAKTFSLKFVDTSGSVGEWNFVSAKLPETVIDPTVITNASADEAGIKTLKTDKNIIGTWSEPDYGTYTFYDDGTAHFVNKYQIDQTYQMFYGITMGYGVELDFKYTVDDGKIYMTVDYFTGESNDSVMTYYLDGKNLVIDGVGYAKVETK